MLDKTSIGVIVLSTNYRIIRYVCTAEYYNTIKCTQTPSSKHAAGLDKFSSFVKGSENISQKIIVCNVKKNCVVAKMTRAVNWQEFLLEL